MSSPRHTVDVQFQSKPVLLGLALAGLVALTACASPPTTTENASVTAPPVAAGLDQDPIDLPMAEANTASLPSTPEAAPEEAEMTVLVLEDQDLLAFAAPTAEDTDLEAEPVSRPEINLFQYSFDAHRLAPEAEEILRHHGRYLREHPEQKVRLTGHTDSQGAEAYNRFLSRLRASAAERILREEGARDHQIESVGAGSEQPAAPGDHAANRRLELTYEVDRIALSD